jgi:hypothetical protein
MPVSAIKTAKTIFVLTLISVGLVSSCGTANINKIFGAKDESYAALLQRAQLAYDLGDYSEAESLANRAYNRSLNNGDAGVLLGSIYLSQAGIDIFQLINKLSSLSSSSSNSGSTDTSDTCASSGSTGANASTNILSELSCKLLSLSEADINALGSTVTTASSSRYSGLSALSINSIYVPNTMSDSVRSNVSVLAALDKGVKRLCPFIDRPLVIDKSTDTRHLNKTTCPDKTDSSYNSNRAHIAFALLNLVESLVMQRGVLIDGATAASSTSSAPTGINSVNQQFNNTTLTLSQFASAVTSYSNFVNDVFATANPDSQISLALNGLLVVNHSFEAAGVPSSVTKALDTQLSALQKVASTLGGSSAAVNQSKALQGQINEKYAKDLASKINAQCPTIGTGACAANQTSLCSSYCGVSTGVDPSKVSKPTICASFTCP